MKLYNSYIKTNKDGGLRDVILIKHGFSFPAFFFNFLWFIYRGMKKGVAMVLIADILLIQLIKLYSPGTFDGLMIFTATSFIIAANANYWHSLYLKTSGYEFVGCVFGESKEAARLRFVQGYMSEYDDASIKNHKLLDKKDGIKSSKKNMSGIKSFVQAFKSKLSTKKT